MIPRKIEDNTQTSGLSNSSASFSVQNIQKLFDLLVQNLYSDKISAVIREISCNAVDSHITAGKPKEPIYVHLPTRLEPHFGVTDFGVSMDHDFMMSGYTYLGYSNKDTSNDVVGGKGIGRLSALAYTDSYTVECVKDGELRIYSVYIKAGIPDIVQMGVTTPTERPTGVTVKVGVRDRDVSTFIERAREVYRFFDPLPEFNDRSFEINKYEVTVEDAGWKCVKHHDKPLAIMGNAAYPVDTNVVFSGDVDKKKYTYSYGTSPRQRFYNSLVMDFNIGDLDIAPSREGLTYDDQTIQLLKDRIEKIEKIILAEMLKKVDASKNIFEASANLYEVNNELKNFGLKEFDNYMFEGKKVTPYLEINFLDNRLKDCTEIAPIEHHRLSNAKSPSMKWNNTTSMKHYAKKMISNGPNLCPYGYRDKADVAYFIIVDPSVDKRIPSRLAQYWKDTPDLPTSWRSSYLIKTSNKKALRDYLKTVICLPDKYIIDFTEDVPAYKPTRVKGGKAKQSGVGLYNNVYRMTIDDFRSALNANAWSLNYMRLNSQNSDCRHHPKIDVSTTSGLYVEVKNWSIQNTKLHDREIANALQYLQQLNHLGRHTHIYIVTKGAKNPFKDVAGWQQLDDFFNDSMKRLLTHRYSGVTLYKFLKRQSLLNSNNCSKLKELTSIKDSLKDTKYYKYLKVFEIINNSSFNTTDFKVVQKLYNILNKDENNDFMSTFTKDFKHVEYLSSRYEEELGNLLSVINTSDLPMSKTSEIITKLLLATDKADVKHKTFVEAVEDDTE